MITHFYMNSLKQFYITNGGSMWCLFQIALAINAIYYFFCWRLFDSNQALYIVLDSLPPDWFPFAVSRLIFSFSYSWVIGFVQETWPSN